VNVAKYFQLLVLLLCPGRVSKYCDEYVCLCLHLSVHSRNSKTAWLYFTKFFVPVTRFSSDGIVIQRFYRISRFHTIEPSRWTGTALCSLPAPLDMAAGLAWADAAHSWTRLLLGMVRILPCASCK